jgi:4a-hydroxytetrahydrobiopterin dehydratase
MTASPSAAAGASRTSRLLIAQIAEAEDHHPDLHLTGYRNVTIELSTHAISGLSENDFVLAARIDELPVELKT